MKLHLKLLLTLATTLTFSFFTHAKPTHREAEVVLFSQRNFQGERIELQPGESIDDFNFQKFPSGRNANNRISSILIRGDLEVSIFDYRSFKGDSVTLQSSIADLSQIPFTNGYENWENELSSISVREPLRRARFHDRNPNAEAIQIVRGAYQDILERIPNRQELFDYVGIVESRDWSSNRLRNELRASDEYRKTVVPNQVRAAYLSILHREPDTAGARHYTNLILNKKWTVTRVEDTLRNSSEFHSQQNAKQTR